MIVVVKVDKGDRLHLENIQIREAVLISENGQQGRQGGCTGGCL